MKKTNMNRLLAFVLAAMMLIGVCTGCNKDAYAELGQLTGATNSQQTTENKNDETKTDDTVADTQQNADSKQVEELQAQLAEVMEKISALEETNATLTAEAEESAKALEAAQKDAEELKARLEKEAKHPMPIINGVLWVHVEDFLYHPTFGAVLKSQKGGYALRAQKGAKIHVYDDEYKDEHLVPNFDLPMKGAYKIVLSNDEGKTAFEANFGNYSWANNGLFTNFASCEFAEELTSITKAGGPGKNYYPMLQAVARVVETENGEKRFCVDADAYKPNPVVSKPATQPETPKTETVVVDKCGICKNLMDECTCKPNVVEIEKCGRCGELYDECDCEPETIVEVETEVVYKKYCGRCDRLLKNCICGDDEPQNNTTNPGWEGQLNNSTNSGWKDVVDEFEMEQDNTNNNTSDNTGWQPNDIEDDDNVCEGSNDEEWLPNNSVASDADNNDDDWQSVNNSSSNDTWEANGSSNTGFESLRDSLS